MQFKLKLSIIIYEMPAPPSNKHSPRHRTPGYGCGLDHLEIEKT